jgi:hypothetical protein
MKRGVRRRELDGGGWWRRKCYSMMFLFAFIIIVWETLAVDKNGSTKARNKRDSRHRKE